MISSHATYEILLYLFILLLCVKPLGWYMARVYVGEPCGLNSRFALGYVEKAIYRIIGIEQDEEMSWRGYSIAMVTFNITGMLFLYGIQRLQMILPYNPQSFAGVEPTLAFNTAASFITNTDWQAYGGESSLSHLTQMMGLGVQNFFSAATGMAIMLALIRGLVRKEMKTLGNYWVDMTRGILYILLPLSIVFSLFLVSQGVIQNFKPDEKVSLLQTNSFYQTQTDSDGKVLREADGSPEVKLVSVDEQVLPMGPVASQIAIKQLGTNGGGFFNTNSAYPYENPTPLSNFLEMLAILLIPASLTYTFGMLVKDKRQGWALLIAMAILVVPLMFAEVAIEQEVNPLLKSTDILSASTPLASGGNMEGKEVRFGIVDSALWTVATSATSNGSVNSMLDSYLPLGGLIPLWLLHLGEVAFGGVGSGIYGMVMLVILAVFIAGLMVGRTPEYLGKKIEPYEMKMSVFAVLLMPMMVLVVTQLAVSTDMGRMAMSNAVPHGFTEILYGWSSMGNNNGSAFAGLNANTTFYNFVGGLVMLTLRYWVAIAILAVAGSLVGKKIIPENSGTLATYTPLFIGLLVGVTLVLAGLTFFPALALGPIVEHFMLWSTHVS